MRRKDDLEMLHQYDIYPPKRFVSLVGEIDEFSVDKTYKNLLALDMISSEPITFYLNTPGGDVYNGLGLYDIIKDCRSHVTIVGNGHCMSMGTIIMQAADDRLVTPNCRMMIHYGSVGIDANVKDFLSAAKDNEELMKRTNKILLSRIREKKPRFTTTQLDRILTVDKYMWPKEYVDMGLADKIVGEE